MALDKGEFNGRPALARSGDRPARRLRTLLVGGDEYVPVYGGAVHADGEVVGRLRAPATGSRSPARSGWPISQVIEIGAKLEVDVLGTLGDAVAEDALVDPANERILA